MNVGLNPSPTGESNWLPRLPTPRDRVSMRTHELAVSAGRSPLEITQADYEQAKRELTGETDPQRQNAVLDAPRTDASLLRELSAHRRADALTRAKLKGAADHVDPFPHAE